jgi:hypothetical protein
LPQVLEDVEAPPGAGAAQRIARIGQPLDLADDEPGDDHRAVQESGIGDVGDAAVDQHGGVEDPGRCRVVGRAR